MAAAEGLTVQGPMVQGLNILVNDAFMKEAHHLPADEKLLLNLLSFIASRDSNIVMKWRWYGPAIRTELQVIEDHLKDLAEV